RVFLPFVPLGIRSSILRALDIDPARRHVGARELAEELAAVKIKHDWETERDEPDEGTWRLQVDGRADTWVLRLGAFPDARVEIYTESPAGRRRKAPAEWSKKLKTERQL